MSWENLTLCKGIILGGGTQLLQETQVSRGVSPSLSTPGGAGWGARGALL